MPTLASSVGDNLFGPDRPDLITGDVWADLFEATALRYPQRVALRPGARQLSYEPLDGLAEQAAHHLSPSC